jgi:hypothetical protein
LTRVRKSYRGREVCLGKEHQAIAGVGEEGAEQTTLASNGCSPEHI